MQPIPAGGLAKFSLDSESNQNTVRKRMPVHAALAHQRGAAPTKIAGCINYIKLNLDKPIQVSTLAALAEASVSYFYSLFKCETGYSPHNYLMRLRIRRACELLEQTNLSVKEIAAALGYNDQLYFSRVFKSILEIPPTRYRLLNDNLKMALREQVLLETLVAPTLISKTISDILPETQPNLSSTTEKFYHVNA